MQKQYPTFALALTHAKCIIGAAPETRMQIVESRIGRPPISTDGFWLETNDDVCMVRPGEMLWWTYDSEGEQQHEEVFPAVDRMSGK